MVKSMGYRDVWVPTAVGKFPANANTICLAASEPQYLINCSAIHLNHTVYTIKAHLVSFLAIEYVPRWADHSIRFWMVNLLSQFWFRCYGLCFKIFAVGFSIHLSTIHPKNNWKLTPDCTETTWKVLGFALTKVWVMEYWRVMCFSPAFGRNQLGRAQNLLGFTDYGLWQLWVKTA
jgi:hypothetical protein